MQLVKEKKACQRKSSPEGFFHHQIVHICLVSLAKTESLEKAQKYQETLDEK